MSNGQQLMSPNQQQVAAWIAVAILVVATVVMGVLAFTSDGELYLDKSGPDPVLTGTWEMASYFIKAGTAVHVIFATVLGVLSIAVTLVASIYTRRRDIAIISGLCLIGIALAAIALVHMSTPPQLQHLHYYGDFTGKSEDDLQGLVRAFFGGFIGWFGVFLAAILGMRIAEASGVLGGGKGSGGGGGAPVPAPAPPAGPANPGGRP